jgi:phosphatidylglycerophosphate synthase
MQHRLAGWWRQIETPSDWLCLMRLALAPVLWVLALLNKPKTVGVGVAVSATTDVLDGVLSRSTGQRSAFGMQFDTAADMAIILSAPGWMALLYPEIAARRGKPLLVLGVGAGVLLSLEWRKMHKVGALHIDSARAAAAMAHGYVLNLFVRGRDSTPLFTGFLVLAVGAAVETAYVVATRDDLAGLSETPLLDAVFRAAGIDNPLDRSPFHDPARRMSNIDS